MVVLAVIVFIRKKDPAPIYGVYQQPGKWYPFKYVIFLAILKLRRVSYRKCCFLKNNKGKGLHTTCHTGTEEEQKYSSTRS
jgi:hypothetical protein